MLSTRLDSISITSKSLKCSQPNKDLLILRSETNYSSSSFISVSTGHKWHLPRHSANQVVIVTPLRRIALFDRQNSNQKCKSGREMITMPAVYYTCRRHWRAAWWGEGGRPDWEIARYDTLDDSQKVREDRDEEDKWGRRPLEKWLR